MSLKAFNSLHFHHPCKKTVHCEKRFGSAAFGYRAVVEDYDFVGIGYRAHPVSDD
jgi:hypothetical protein